MARFFTSATKLFENVFFIIIPPKS